MIRGAVLVSGNGTKFQSLLDSIFFGEIPELSLVAVISSDPAAYALTRAKNAQIETVVVEPGMFPNESSYDMAIRNKLKDMDIDFVIVAGFQPGVGRETAKAFRDKIIVPLGTVHLLRAMAKVEVLGTKGPWTIEEVKLHNYNGFGYCAPADVFNEADYVRYDYALDFNTNIHIPTGAFMQSALSLGEVASEHFVIYVPEYQNTLNGIGIGNKATLGIRFKERIDKEYAVDFKYYQSPSADVTEGTPFDIRRNYDYRFVIHKVGEEAELQLSVDVLPYTQYDLYPEFGQ